MEESKQILVAITELQTNVRNMSEKINEIGKISTMVVQTEQSVKSAHMRIDDVKIDFAKEVIEVKRDYNEKVKTEERSREKIEGNITWLWRTIGAGAITLFFGLLLQAIKFFGG